jgi:hypothetical protein
MERLILLVALRGASGINVTDDKDMIRLIVSKELVTLVWLITMIFVKLVIQKELVASMY